MRRASHVAALLLLASVAGLHAQTPARNEGPIAQAKVLYANADYDGSLAALAAIEASTPAGLTYEGHYYRALCLIAIGRMEDAERALAATVEANPTFSPSPADLSPRVQALFADVRERSLPQVARRLLTDARTLARDGAPDRALVAIDDALTVLNDPKLLARADLDDLRLAAGTMRELTIAQAAAAAQTALATPAAAAEPGPEPPAAAASVPTAMPPAPALSPLPASADMATSPVVAAVSTTTTPPVTAVSTAAVATSPVAAPRPVASVTAASPALGPQPAATAAPSSPQVAPQQQPAATAAPVPAIVPPVAIKQDMPRWNPNDAMAREANAGSIRVKIDAAGRVTGAQMEQPVHPQFDVLMLDAVKGWRYRPALRNGQPIPWESAIAIKVAPATR